MKKTIFYFLALLLAVWLGVTMHRYPGYVLIATNDISIETSLLFAVATLIFLVIVFYAILRFSSGLGAITSHINQWLGKRRIRRARKQTVLGLYDLIEGDWAHAEKKLLHSAKDSDMPLVNYLAAAFMAQHQHALKQRDVYLRLAQKVAQDRPLTVGIAQASLYIGDRQWEEASVTLQRLHKLQPRNVFILQLLHQVYLELKNWVGLEKLLSVLRKRKVFSLDYFNKLEEIVYQELLTKGVQDGSIVTAWCNLPRYLQRKPVLVAIYAQYLLQNHKVEEAEALLKIVLHKVLDERLLELYAKLPSTKPIKHLSRAEKWLQGNPKNASLLLCVGRICCEQKLWGKAIHYLEKSVKIEPTLNAYAELGHLMSLQGDWQKALVFYDKAVKLSRISTAYESNYGRSK